MTASHFLVGSMLKEGGIRIIIFFFFFGQTHPHFFSWVLAPLCAFHSSLKQRDEKSRIGSPTKAPCSCCHTLTFCILSLLPFFLPCLQRACIKMSFPKRKGDKGEKNEREGQEDAMCVCVCVCGQVNHNKGRVKRDVLFAASLSVFVMGLIEDGWDVDIAIALIHSHALTLLAVSFLPFLMFFVFSSACATLFPSLLFRS
ncbi:MAG: hypothetical protein JOS17DRAFT_309359 [Linnemannia elongata]|nr:MAG: hypothetical protein JOS17DRAFT_309359 [Linnemannia elongata]